MKAPLDTRQYYMQGNYAPPLTHGAQLSILIEVFSFQCVGKVQGYVALIRRLCAKGKIPMLIERIETMMNVDHARRDGSFQELRLGRVRSSWRDGLRMWNTLAVDER